MSHSAPQRLRVIVGTTPAERREYHFDRPFRIGRVEECEVCIKDDHVSRAHAEVAFQNGQWWIRDLNSSNGIFVEGQRVQSVPVAQRLAIRLGIYGPAVGFEVEAAATQQSVSAAVPSETMVHRYIERYFTAAGSTQMMGEHTMMVRQAFQQVQKKQKRKYLWIVGGLVLCILAVGAYALYESRQARRQREMAQDLFYAMKSLDVDIANVEKLLLDSNNPQGQEQVRKYRERRREMEKSYDQFLTAHHVYDPKMTERERLVLRVARIFGECELAMPPEFAREVDNYIKKWQGSDRLARAIRTAKANGYQVVIGKELLAQGLPPQFFYLALQESDFDPYISGPMTRKGIAKGMWQFIPETAEKYGLRVGPLVELRRPDTGDDRHNWERATRAAARYLKDLYTTDAQASALLVMACYNWGEDRVLPLVRGMPANPRERNFWKLLTSYRQKVPEETYNYVFYIASAAVIGENPRLFGFDFDNPLGYLEK